MIEYTKNLLRKIKEASLGKKIFIAIILVLYFGVILLCTISAKYNYVSPGTLNRINEVINIEDVEVTNKFYTVGVFTETKSCSLLEYLLRKADPKQDIIPKEEYNSIYTQKEENKAGEAQKIQSIQDSVICAYEIAKEDNPNINLVKEYVGVMICYMPCNSIGSGPESLQSKDVITKFGDTVIDSYQTLDELVSYYYENERYKDPSYKVPSIEIIRSGEKLTLDSCNILNVAYLGYYYHVSKDYCNKNGIDNYYCYLVNYLFDYYDLKTSESNPKFKINDATSIGPSGGLCQTLYVYNALTDNSLLKTFTGPNELITATGTIISDGTVGVIGAIDKKVYTIDIYMTKYFFVPKDNYDEAMETYNKLKNPSFEIVKADNARDAIKYLRELSGESNA